MAVEQDEVAPCPWQVHECVRGQHIDGGREEAEEKLGFLHRHRACLAGR